MDEAWAPGSVVGEYRLVRRLGAGGMAAVDLAEHVATGARRAIKSLAARDPELLLRFLREGEAMARVEGHPHVVRVHGTGVALGRHYIVMDHLPGGDLAERLRRGTWSPDAVRRLGVALARGLAHVHARGVLHRDVKPTNVLFDAHDRPVLVDFGLSLAADATSLTGSQEILGTPSYMAPEQALGHREAVGPHTDVYGLGAVLYHALTGRPPAVGSSPLEALASLIRDTPPPPRALAPDVPEALEAVVLRALAKLPAERFASAEELARALGASEEELGSGETTAPSAPTAATPLEGLAPPRTSLAEGEVVGGLVVERELGRGGTAVVYRARDPKLDRPVALKVIDASRLGDDGLERFAREAELAARVDAVGGIVRVHARGVHRGAPYLVLELVEGRDLRAELRAGPMDPKRLARIVEGVARALARCHALGVVHRDLKPANVLLRALDDAPVLTDFGLARDLGTASTTRTGVTHGTPAYMSPERVLDPTRAADARVDVFALGAILYHGLAGRPPGKVLERLHADVPPPSALAPGVDPALEDICLRAMSRDPARRQPGAEAVADELARWRAGDRTPSRRGRRGRRALALGGAALLVVAAAAGLASGRAAAGRALERAAEAEARVVPALLSDAAAAASFSAAELRQAAADVEALRALLPAADGPRARVVVERLQACARLLAPEAAPAARPPADPLARAAEALLVARRDGPRAGLALLEGAPAARAPLARAVEVRLRDAAATSDAEFLAWAATARPEPLAWSAARRRALARVEAACRALARRPAPGAVQEARGLLADAAALDPALPRQALSAAVAAFVERFLDEAADDGQERAALEALLRLHAAAGTAPGEAERQAVGVAFVRLHRRLGLQLDPRRGASTWDPLLAWDDAVASIEPPVAPPHDYLELLARLGDSEVQGLPVTAALAFARRGTVLDRRWSWVDLGHIAGGDPGADGLGADHPSAAVRLSLLAREVVDAAGSRPWKQVDPRGLPRPLLQRVRAGLERVLAAPRADLAPRYVAEAHLLRAEALVALHRTPAPTPPTPAQARDLREALADCRASRRAFEGSPWLLERSGWLEDEVHATLGAPREERARALEEVVAVLRATVAAAGETGRLEWDEDLRTAEGRLALGYRVAGFRNRAVALLREALEQRPPALRGEQRLGQLLAILGEERDEGAVDELLDRTAFAGLGDPGFARAFVERALRQGERDLARRALARAREANPAEDWAPLQAQVERE